MTDEAKKLVEALREDAEWAHSNEWEIPITLGDHLEEAADLIEKLSAQLVNQATEYSQALKITTEQRDAAADDIELGVCCETCKHDNDDDEGAFCVGCVRIASRGNWEWRGVKNNAE